VQILFNDAPLGMLGAKLKMTERKNFSGPGDCLLSPLAAHMINRRDPWPLLVVKGPLSHVNEAAREPSHCVAKIFRAYPIFYRLTFFLLNSRFRVVFLLAG
jgi:hypothetical protein